MPDAAISWYHLPNRTAEADLVPGDCHGPDGPRNDSGGRDKGERPPRNAVALPGEVYFF